MKSKKIIASALTVSLLSTGFISTKAAAEEVDNNVPKHTAQAPVQTVNFNLKTTMENNLLVQSISPSDLKDIEGISEYFNLTPEEKQVFLDAAANKDDSGFETRGKLSWAAKAIKKLWNELPGPVKDRLGRQSALITIANRVEHYTGALEDAIYAGVLDVVGNPTAAWWITKSITLLL
ncbi:hypothetical protein KU891_28280 (plasmid) [Bacillus tropicus]|uniref:hypothetical protein n=1 Tax=Bacillus tropicus TaxID=2026188 RepID=UPI0020064D4C|nr:hypothetical protein [Bacillus tropicus]UOK49431.1 hypothetical protein KU891_28280 [Bacillus tropicus]